MYSVMYSAKRDTLIISWSKFIPSGRRTRLSMVTSTQKSRYLASRKSEPLTREINSSFLAGVARIRAFKRVFRRLGNLWIFFKAREKSSNLRSTQEKARERKGMGKEGGTEGIARVEENGEKEFSASRKNAHCVHARGQLPLLSFSPCHPLSYPYFFRFVRRKRTRKERESEMKRREQGAGIEDKIPNFRGRFAMKGSRSRLLARVFRWKDFSAEFYIIDRDSCIRK